MMPADNRTQRRERHREETRKSRRIQKAVVALGASLAVGAGAAGSAYADSLNTNQVAENSYSTVENLIAIADNLGRTQIALLAPVGKSLPEGWVPVVTSEHSTTSRQLTFLEALTESGKLVLAVPDSSSIPGTSTSLSGISPQAAQVLAALPLADTLGSGAQVYAKMGSTLIQLNGINLQTLAQNTLADVKEVVGGDKVSQHAGELTGIPSIDDALGFWTGSQTTSRWTGSASFLGSTSTTWINQDRISVNGITSEQLKALFAQNLNTPNALVVDNGSNHVVQTGTRIVVITPEKRVCVFNKCVTIPAVAAEVPVYGTEWIGETDDNGNQVQTTTYNPNDAIPGALSALDGIDVGGFSVISRQVGSTFAGRLGSSAGWQGAVTQVIVPGAGDAEDYVATVPVFAAGISLPDNLFTTGMQLSPGLVTTSGQSVNSILGTRSATFSIPTLGLAAERTSLLESSHLGPDGIAYNSGWTVATIKVGDTTVPLVYSLGSFDVGPNGFGVTGPSFMGVGLPGFQIGTGPSTASAVPDVVSNLLGDIPTSVITLSPSLLFQLANIEDPSGGVLSDPIGTLERVLTPLFAKYVTPTATQISQAIADAATRSVNEGSAHAKAASDWAVDASATLADKTEHGLASPESPTSQPESASSATPQSDTAETSASAGRHALPDGERSQFAPSGSNTPKHAATQQSTDTSATDTTPSKDSGAAPESEASSSAPSDAQPAVTPSSGGGDNGTDGSATQAADAGS